MKRTTVSHVPACKAIYHIQGIIPITSLCILATCASADGAGSITTPLINGPLTHPYTVLAGRLGRHWKLAHSY